MLFENILFRVGRCHLYGEQGDMFKTFDILFCLNCVEKESMKVETKIFLSVHRLLVTKFTEENVK